MSSDVRLAQHEGYIFIVTTAMTPDQVRTVQESFQQLAPHAAHAAQMFYDELFRIAPEARGLFPTDMTGQHRKFVQMLAMVVKSLGNISTVSEHIADLGRRHAAYDVSERHYALVARALLVTLHRFFGSRYTPEIQSAWSAAYNMLARMMFESAAAGYSKDAFFGSIVRGVITSQYGVAEAFSAQQEQPSHASPLSTFIQKKHSY
jgi:hemoglobin-like flavoprotein